MTTQNVHRLRSAHAAFSRGDLDTALTLVAADCAFTDHGRGAVLSGREEFRQWMADLIAMSSDVRITAAQYIDAGETVIAQFTAEGIQDGPMEPFPPSGRPFTLDVCEVWQFNADGEAVEGHNYSDGLGMLVQLGHLALPA